LEEFREVVQVPGIYGQIPESIVNCTNLMNFIMATTNITGVVPAGLFSLPKIEIINLGQTSLEGPFPTSLSASLREMFVASFFRYGFVGLLEDLLTKFLVLNFESVIAQTNISGAIPSQITLCVNLTRFDIGRTKMSGPLPAGLFQLPKLASIDVGYTGVSGVLPQSMSPTITFLFVPFFPLARSVLCLASLTPQFSAIGFTNITGNIAVACTLPSLVVLSAPVIDLSATGELPHCLFQIPTLVVLDLSITNMRGTLPETTNLPEILQMCALFGSSSCLFSERRPRLPSYLFDADFWA
jgi:hypothetical protein